MTAQIIDGRAIAQAQQDDLKSTIADHNLLPQLSIILANNNPASEIYVARKMEACRHVGIEPVLHQFPADTDEETLIKQIEALNDDQSVHGIFLQLPLGDHLDTNHLINAIDPQKDVDGLTHTNLGKVMTGDDDGLTPCTPQGVMALLAHQQIDLTGKHAVIIGRSLLFGKPMGQLLLQANCTVTQCHSKTENLSNVTKQADILIAAVGQPKMIKETWVKQGATIIDVGITRMNDGTICGDVDFNEVSKIAGAITPVPGGVGPMTVACLLSNTVRACSTFS